ncbi:hypothetical protein MRB53_038767 [Persea americana]|nr:hypothetical protein MRB53_038767 [Persea americana]
MSRPEMVRIFPGHDWFFKYKFEEPYLMYRQWRECTKAVIAGRMPTPRKHKAITAEYLSYAKRQLAKDPEIGKQYNKNHGIIAMREGFLKEKGVRGSDIIPDVVLVPIATLGCGKTTIAIALTKLFGWGHEQNDNIQGKSNRPARFVKALADSLTKHNVVIADRNNHQKRERTQLIADLDKVIPDAKVRCVALGARPSKVQHNPQDPARSRAQPWATITRPSRQGQSQRRRLSASWTASCTDSSLRIHRGRRDENFDLIIDLDTAGLVPRESGDGHSQAA